jgi:hypothetical protein
MIVRIVSWRRLESSGYKCGWEKQGTEFCWGNFLERDHWVTEMRIEL